MKNKISVVFLLMGLVALSACAKTNQLSISDEAYFKQKQECQKYLPAIKEEAKKSDDEYNRFGSRTTIIGKAFFSPRRNSCLYIYTEAASYLGKDGNPVASDTARFVLFDILSNEEVMHTNSTKGDEDYWEAQRKFDAMVKEYE